MSNTELLDITTFPVIRNMKKSTYEEFRTLSKELKLQYADLLQLLLDSFEVTKKLRTFFMDLDLEKYEAQAQEFLENLDKTQLDILERILEKGDEE